MKILTDSGVSRLWNNIKNYLKNTYVQNTTTVNEKSLSDDITLKAEDFQTSATDTKTLKENIDSILNDYLPITAGNTKPLTQTLYFKNTSPQLYLNNTAIDFNTTPATTQLVGQMGRFRVYQSDNGLNIIQLDGRDSDRNVYLVSKPDNSNYVYFRSGGLSVHKGNMEADNMERAGWSFDPGTGKVYGTTKSASSTPLNFVNTSGKYASLIMCKDTATSNYSSKLPDEDGYFVTDSRPTVSVKSNGITVQTKRQGPFVYAIITLDKGTGVSAATYKTQDGVIPAMYRPYFRACIPPVTADPDNSQTLRFLCQVSPSGQVSISISGALNNNYQQFRGIYLVAYQQYNIFK